MTTDDTPGRRTWLREFLDMTRDEVLLSVPEEHRAKEYLNRIAGPVFSSSPQEIIDTAEEVHIYRKTDQ